MKALIVPGRSGWLYHTDLTATSSVILIRHCQTTVEPGCGWDFQPTLHQTSLPLAACNCVENISPLCSKKCQHTQENSHDRWLTILEVVVEASTFSTATAKLYCCVVDYNSIQLFVKDWCPSAPIYVEATDWKQLQPSSCRVYRCRTADHTHWQSVCFQSIR